MTCLARQCLITVRKWHPSFLTISSCKEYFLILQESDSFLLDCLETSWKPKYVQRLLLLLLLWLKLLLTGPVSRCWRSCCISTNSSSISIQLCGIHCLDEYGQDWGTICHSSASHHLFQSEYQSSLPLYRKTRAAPLHFFGFQQRQITILRQANCLQRMLTRRDTGLSLW